MASSQIGDTNHRRTRLVGGLDADADGKDKTKN